MIRINRAIFHHGDRVLVFGRIGPEKGGSPEYAGAIVGRSFGRSHVYDVLPDNETQRQFSIPEHRMVHEKTY